MNQIISNSKKNVHQIRPISNFSPSIAKSNNINNSTGYANKASYFNQTNSVLYNKIPFLNNNNNNTQNIDPIRQNNQNNMSYLNMNTNNFPNLNNINMPYINYNNNPYMYNNFSYMNHVNRNNLPYVNSNIPNMFGYVPGLNNEFVSQSFQTMQQQTYLRSKSLTPKNQNMYHHENPIKSFEDSMPHSKNLNSPTNNLQKVPEYIKNQIEAILNETPDNKIKASDFFKAYVSKYKTVLISDAYSFPSFKDLVLSFGDSFSIEPVPGSYEYYVCKNASPKYVADENNNSVQTISPIINTKLNDSAYSDFTEINKYEEIKDSAEILTKKISLTHIEEKKLQEIVYDFNLISIRDGEAKRILIHWLQVANLFEIKPSAFKRNYLNDLKYPMIACISKYKMNENNKILFDLVEEKLNVNLKEYEDTDETTFFLKDSLKEACDYIFNKNNCQFLKELIKKI